MADIKDRGVRESAHLVRDCKVDALYRHVILVETKQLQAGIGQFE